MPRAAARRRSAPQPALRPTPSPSRTRTARRRSSGHPRGSRPPGGPTPTSAGIPFEDIAATSPDLILGLSSGVSKEDYDKLTKIAPVVPHTVAPWGTPWQDQLETIGTALGRSAQAAELEASTTKTITDAVAATPQIAGKSAAWAWFSPTDLSTIGLYTTADLRPQMLREFGFVDSPTVIELIKADPSAFSVNLSADRSRARTCSASRSAPAPVPSSRS